MTTYIAVLTPIADGYSIQFPDLPDCPTATGGDLEAAIAAARAALRAEISRMQSAHIPLPPARDFLALRYAKDARAMMDLPISKLTSIDTEDAPSDHIPVLNNRTEVE